MRDPFETGCPRSRGWKNFECRWTRGVLGLENWKIFLDVICVSSLICLTFTIVVTKYSEILNWTFVRFSWTFVRFSK